MRIRVDSKRIRAERERRAWSQEQLANETGLGLRTVQRIEKTGTASARSLKALAAVFSVTIDELRADAAHGAVPSPGAEPSPAAPSSGENPARDFAGLTLEAGKIGFSAMFGAGAAVGTSLYQLFAHGVADLGRAVFIGAFVFVVWILLLSLLETLRPTQR